MLKLISLMLQMVRQIAVSVDADTDNDFDAINNCAGTDIDADEDVAEDAVVADDAPDAVVADDAPDAEEGTDAVADSVDAVVDSDRGACHNWTAPSSARS